MTHAKPSPRARSAEAEQRSSGNGGAPAASSSSTRLLPVSAKIDLALSREIDEYAKTHGITRSRAAGQFLQIAREALRAREGVPATPGVRSQPAGLPRGGVRPPVRALGRRARGAADLRSAAPSCALSTQTGGLKVSEDELLAELRTVAGDEWEQALSEAERDLHLALKKARTEGRA